MLDDLASNKRFVGANERAKGRRDEKEGEKERLGFISQFDLLVLEAAILRASTSVRDKTRQPVCSGGASAVKKPGHFDVRKSSSRVTRSQGVARIFSGVPFFLKKVDDLF